jgi:hypothetical protein
LDRYFLNLGYDMAVEERRQRVVKDCCELRLSRYVKLTPALSGCIVGQVLLKGGDGLAKG